MRIGDAVDILLTDPDSFDSLIAYYPNKRPTPVMLSLIDKLPAGLVKESDQSLYQDAYDKVETKLKLSRLIKNL